MPLVGRALAAEALQHFGVTELGKCAGFDLADTLARDAKLASNLLQRERVAVTQPETKLKHELLAWGQDIIENVLHLLLHGASGGRFFRRSAGFVGEHVAKLLLLVFANGKLKGDGRAGGGFQLVQALYVHTQRVGQLLLGRVAAKLLYQTLSFATNAIEGGVDVDREPDGTALVGDRAADGLADPPGGVCAEAVSTTPIVALHGAHQPDIALLDEIQQGEATAYIALGDANDQAEVGQHELLYGFFIAGFDTFRQVNLLGVTEHGNSTDFPQIRGDRVNFRRFAALGGPCNFLRSPHAGDARSRLVGQVDERHAVGFHGVNATFDCLVFLHAGLLFLVVNNVNVRG